MSFQVECPNCGLRPAGEFRYGGPVQQRPQPADTDAKWTDYLYNKPNVRGVQTEWWHHVSACKLWFLVERDTHINRVLASRLSERRENAGD
jgi:sarcosine oxidase subunit delta